MKVTDEMVKRAAEATYGPHFERYRGMMRKALEAALSDYQTPEPPRCACGGIPYNPYPGWLDEQEGGR